MKLIVIDKTYGRAGALWAAVFGSQKNKLLHLVFDVLIHEPEINLADTDGAILLTIKQSPLKGEGGGTAPGLVDGRILKMRLESRSDLARMVRSFCHEMVHARQIFTNQLVQDRVRKVVRWNGEEIPALKVKLAQLMGNVGASMGMKPLLDEYKRLPWEEESYRLEPILYRRLKKKLLAGMKK